MSPYNNVIFFDGVCVLCHWSVDQILKIDKKGTFSFASLEGDTAQQVLGPISKRDQDSVILLMDGQIYDRSEAVLKILGEVGGLYGGLARVLRLCPMVLRNGVYSFVAKHRYKVFGVSEFCRQPSPKDRHRFLN